MRKLHFSLRTAIILPLIMTFTLIIISVALVQTITYEEMIQSISEKQLKTLTQNITANLDNFLLAPFKISQTMSADIEYQLTDKGINFERLQSYLFYAYQNLKVHIPQFSFIGFGSELTGELIGIKYVSDDEFYFLRSKKNDLIIYKNDDLNNIDEIIPNYNAKARPWYIPAAKTKKPMWSDLYFNPGKNGYITMSALSPIIKNNNLLGVFVTDINLYKFNDFLSLQLQKNNASIFIFDNNGRLIANSFEQTKNSNTNSSERVKKTAFTETKQIHVTDTGIPLINIAAKTALDLSLHTSKNDEFYSFSYNKKRYFGVITPYRDDYGIDWNIAIVLPENELVGNLPQLQHSALFGLLFYCIVIAIIGFILFNRITASIKATDVAVSSFAKGKWDVQAPTDSSIVEIQRLGETFNKMSSHISSSFDRLKNQLWYDSLTHLLKSKGLVDKYDQLKHKKGIVIIFSVEKFCEINDSLGLDKADQVLIEVAQKIKSISPSNALVSRFSNHEFAIYIPNILDTHCTNEFIYRLKALFDLPIQVEGEFVIIHHAIGSAFTTSDQLMRNTLRHALIALNNAKKDPSLYAAYHPEMAEISIKRSNMVSQLTQAIENEEFEPFYQPLIDLKTNTVIGAEALARWLSPDRGLIAPNDFIPLSEEYGLIHKIGYQILFKACRDAKKAITEGLWHENFHLHVNISVNQLLVASFGENLKKILKETGLPNKNLTLELTESNFMSENVIVKNNMALIKSLGIGIAIDDFGTGYSSLSCLQQIEFNCLKIDRSFISNMSLNPEADSVISAILAISRNFDAIVVSEGIEKAEQAKILTELGCEQGQGYFYSKPIPFDKWPYDVSGKIS